MTNMIRLINRVTGGDMWVAEERLDKYLAAGHKLAADLPEPESVDAPAPVTKRTRRRTKKE